MQLIRLNKSGQHYFINTICGEPNKCTIKTMGKVITVNCSQQELSQSWYNWQMKGLKIQDAFPQLTNAEREFIMTGITEEQWKRMFSDESDESD